MTLLVKRSVRWWAAGVVAVALGACVEESTGPLLLVTAHRSYLGATVVIDGTELGTLGELMFNTGLVAHALNAAYPESPTRDLVGVNVDLSRATGGAHQVAVRKAGLQELVVDFELPFRDGEKSCMVSLLPTYQSAGPACEVRRGAS